MLLIKKNPSFLNTLIFLTLTLSSAANAMKYQVSAYGGGTTTNFSNPTQLYYVGETDELVSTNNNFSNTTWGLAAAIRIPPPFFLKNIIEEFSLGPEYFNFSTTTIGEVWQYQLSEMNNLTYRIPVSSSRLLITDEITFKPIVPDAYPFFEWGLGVAANQAFYVEYPRPTFASTGLNLSNNTLYNFSYTLGGGVKFDISHLANMEDQKLQLSLRYLYAHLGRAEVTSHALLRPISINMSTQTWVAGLSYLF